MLFGAIEHKRPNPKQGLHFQPTLLRVYTPTPYSMQPRHKDLPSNSISTFSIRYLDLQVHRLPSLRQDKLAACWFLFFILFQFS